MQCVYVLYTQCLHDRRWKCVIKSVTLKNVYKQVMSRGNQKAVRVIMYMKDCIWFLAKWQHVYLFCLHFLVINVVLILSCLHHRFVELLACSWSDILLASVWYLYYSIIAVYIISPGYVCIFDVVLTRLLIYWLLETVNGLNTFFKKSFVLEILGLWSIVCYEIQDKIIEVGVNSHLQASWTSYLMGRLLLLLCCNKLLIIRH